MSTQLILSELNQINQSLNSVNQRFDQVNLRLDKIDQRLDEHSKKLAEHDSRFDTVFELLGTIQDQTKKIPHIEKDIHDLKNDMGVIKKVLIDRNKQISRHERFINHIKAAI